MKRIILLFVFMMVSVFPSSNAELNHENIQNFDKHWVEFMRYKYACPITPGVIEWKNCNPKLGSINYEEFNKARNLAKKIFDLEDSSSHK